MLPQSLPVALDGYRFWGGGWSEQKHLLFTDNYLLNDDEANNYFSIGPLDNKDTFVRIYVEDSGIGMHLSCTGSSHDDKQLGPAGAGAFLHADIPQDSTCKISLYHASKEMLNRKVYLEEKVRATVLIADKKFV
jgi:hypothetical protein